MLLLCCAIFWSPFAWADDSSSGVMLPGLRAEPSGAVRVTKAAVALSNDHIVATLTLRRIGATGASLVIFGPLFRWLGEAEPYPDRQFPELKATLDGIDVAPEKGFAAFVDQSDITSLVRAAGLDPFTIADTPPFVDPPSGSGLAAFDRLLALHAVQKSDNQFLARWTARQTFRFAIGEKAGPVLSLSYLARPGFRLLKFRDLGEMLRPGSYCVSPMGLADRLGPGAQAGDVVAKTYDIAVGVDGKSPDQVSLTVSSERAVFCATDGTAAFSRPGEPSRPARVGRDSILHVLELALPG
jgi:hypothetical protein